MHVIRISKRLPPSPGGLEQHALRVSLEQAQLGVRTLLVFSNGFIPETPFVQGILISKKHETYRPELLSDFIFMNEASKVIRASCHQANVVHTHGGAMLCASGASLARRLGAVHCHTIHGALSNTYVRNRIWSWALASSDHIFCVSKAIEEFVKSLSETSVSVRSSGFDPLIFYPLLSDLPSFPPWKLITVGRLHPLKGLHVLLDACLLLKNKEVAYQLDVVGDGSLRESYEKIASENHLPVTFHGTLGSAKVAEMLRQSHIFVNSSVTLPQQSEGTPTAIIEAMACALPIVATDNGGTSEIIINKKTGLLCPENSPLSLALAIEELIGNPELRQRLGASAHEYIRAYSWTEVAKNLLIKYEEILSSSHKKSRTQWKSIEDLR